MNDGAPAPPAAMTLAASAPIPAYNAPPTDPSIAAVDAAAQSQSIASIQSQEKIDSASLLARYGMRLSMANAPVGSPLVAPPG